MTLTHAESLALTRRVIGLAIEVHRQLGPGLLESNYEACLCWELANAAIPFSRQPCLPVTYKGVHLGIYCRPDIIIGENLVVEIKAVEKLADVHRAQVLSYMKHIDTKIGLLFNFNASVLKHGIIRVVR